MSSVLPGSPSNAAGSVAFKQVGKGQEAVGEATVMPRCAPLNKTLALLAKFVPVNWIGKAVVGFICAGVLEGVTLVSVGAAEGTTNVSELLFAVPTETET